MAVVLNGERRELPAGMTLRRLLGELGLDPRTVVVELNRQVIRPPALEETVLSEGDRVELVHFVGGG